MTRPRYPSPRSRRPHGPHMRAHLAALAAGCAALALALPAFAQSSERTSDGIDLPDVVVSATRTATPEREVASSVTVITEQDIERAQNRSVPDVLQAVPGLNVVQTGGPGGTTSIFMRGTNSNQVKILVDGIDLSDPSSSNGAFDISQLMTNDISRIEVLRGPQSGLYGSDAIGGVISITTKKGEGPAKFTGFIEGGALGTFNQAMGVSGSKGNLGYAFNVGHFSSTSIPVTPSNLVAPGWPINNNSYDNWTYSGRIDAQLSETFALNLVGRYISSQLSYTPDLYEWPTGSYLAAQRSTSFNRTLLGKAEGVWTALDGALVNTFGVSATDISRPTTGPNLTWNGTYDGDEQNYYWRSLYSFAKGQSLLVGVERKNQSMTSSTYYSSSDLTSASTGDSAAYAQLQTGFGDRFFLAANVRYDSDDDFGDHTTYRLAPAILFPETGTKLKATYGTGFNAPTMYQLYAPYYGNASLKPEESEGWDAGFEQSVFSGRVTFGATYFHNDITNLIGYDPVTYQNVNISSATTKGVEAFVAMQVTDKLNVRVDYTYTDAVGHYGADDSFGASCAPATDSTCDLLRRPNNKVSVAANWQATDALSLNATLIYVSSWWDVPRLGGSYIDQPGYTIVNVAANYAINANTSIYGRINNLFDETYEEPNGWLAPGFGAYAGLRFTY